MPSPVATATTPCENGTLQLTGTPDLMSSYLWIGPNGFSSSVQNPTIANVTLSASGTYTLTVTNASGCTATTTVAVTIYKQPTAFAGNPATICPGNTFVLSAATASDYSSLLWTTSGDGTFNDVTLLKPIYIPGPNDLSSGTVTLTITAQGFGSNCNPASSSLKLTILNLTASLSHENITCFGAGDGIISVLNAKGGSGVYEFFRDGETNWIQQSDLPFKNVPKGNYTILMRDKNFPACTTIIGSVEILEPNQLSATVSKNDASCLGNDGIISITGAIGGWGQYHYRLNNGNWQLSGDFTDLISGKYEVWIGDADFVNCMVSLGEIEIKLPPPLTAEVLPQNISCNGKVDGSIAVSNPTGGSGVYEFRLNNDNWKLESELPFTNLSSGGYIVQVRDFWSKECVNTIGTYTITEPDKLMATATPTPISCFNVDDGKITVTGAIGGSKNYQYRLNEGNWQPSGVFSGLAPGTYEVWMGDADAVDCKISLGEFTFVYPPQLMADVATSTITCYGANDGKITVTNPQNGLAPYLFTVTNIAGGFSGNNNNGLFTGLGKGDYLVKMRDAKGCEQELGIYTIVEPERLTATVEHTDETCKGTDASITIFNPQNSVSGLYNFNIGKGWSANYNAGSPFVVTGLVGGTYTISIRDANLISCEQNWGTITIDAPIPLAANADKTDVTCNGAKDGTITVVNQSGGSTLYQYSINNVSWQDEPFFSGLAPGSITLYMRDKKATDCSISIGSFTITEPAKLQATAVAVDVTCFGGSDGKITFAGASGGTESGNYEYSIDGTNWHKNQISNLPKGTYTVQMRDGKVPACVVLLPQVVIDQPERLTATLTAIPVKCFGESNGEIRITEPKNGLGAESDYNYRINGGTWTNVSVFTGLPAGTYTIEIQDGLNTDCTATLSPTTVSQPATPLVAVGSPSHTNETTPGANDGTITVIPPTGGTPPYQYSIDSGAIWTTTLTFTALPPGSYTVLARDANLCQVSLLPVQIILPAGTITADYTLTPIKCFGGSDGRIEFKNPSGALGGNYRFSIDGGGSWGAVNQFVFDNRPPGTYTLMILDAVIGTNSSTIATITLSEPSAPVSALVVPTGETAFNANDGIITISNFAGGSGGYQYRLDGGSWIPAAGTVVIQSLAPKVYTVDIRDVNGCPATYYPVDVPRFTTGKDVLATVIPSPTCFGPGTTNGKINISNVSGGLGTGTYQYRLVGHPVYGNWANVKSDKTAEIAGLAKGTYDLEIRDDNVGSVIYKTQAVVTELSEIKVTLSADPIACFGGDTYVNFDITGRTPPYKKFYNGFEISSFAPKAGTYPFTIVDANGCSVPASITIDEPAEIIMGAKGNNPKNCGERGSIDFTFTNVPNGNYNVLYSDGANNLSRNVSVVGGKASWLLLPTGKYENMRVLVKGCYSKETTVLISDPLAPTYLAQGSNPTICAGKDGFILVTGLNTNTTYSVSINNGATYTNTTSSVDGKITIGTLAAGSYDVVLKLNNCTGAPVRVVLNDPPTPTLSVIAINPAKCNTNGRLDFTFTNVPAGTYTITYNDGTIDRQFTNVLVAGTGSTTSATVNVPAGTYNNLKIALNGCQSNAVSVTITDVLLPPTPFAVVFQKPTCSNPTQIIRVTELMPSGKYHYSVDGVNYQPSFVFVNLPVGKYTVWVKDVTTQCISKGNEVGEELPVISVTPTAIVAQPDCNWPTGSIEVTQPLAGTGFEYRLDGGTYTSGTTFANLAPGSLHTITIKETLTGCEASIVKIIDPLPDAPDAPIVRVTDQPDCVVTTGTIVVTEPVGPGYTYSLNGGSWTSSVTFIGLTSGLYQVRVKEIATGCISDPVDLTIDPIPNPPAAPTAGITKQPSCLAPSGEIVVTSPIGSDYKYSIDDGAHWTSSTTFAGLNPGSYSITVMDISTGCISLPSAAQVVNEVPEAPKAPVAKVVQGFPNCITPFGIIEITSPVPLPPGYRYSLNGVKGTSFVIVDLVPGNYSLRVIDATGCESPDILLVVPGIPDPPALKATVINPDCIVRTGTISVTVENRVVGESYRYSINNGSTWQNVNEFTGLNPGTYSVTVMNVTTSCPSTISVTIPPAPEIPVAPALAAIQPDCTLATGTILVTLPVGPGYTYSLNGGTPTSSTTFGNLTPGEYKVVAISGGGCTSTESIKTISPHSLSPAAPTVESTQPTCTVATGTIRITGPIGLGYSYSKDGITYQTDTNFTNLMPGTYTMTVKNSEGCISPGYIQIIDEQPPTPFVPDISYIQPTCQVETGTIIINSPTGVGYTYSIGGTYTESTTFSGLSPGNYKVTVKTNAGCISEANATIEQVPDPPLAPVVSVQVKPTCNVSTGTLVITPPLGSDYLYRLDGDAYTTVTTFANVAVGLHTVTVLDETTSCTSSASVLVEREKDPPAAILEVSQPSCFSPMGIISVKSPVDVNIYRYSLDGKPYTSTTTFTNLVAGSTYTLTVLNVLTGCVSTPVGKIIDLLPENPPTPSATVTVNPTCDNPDGTVEVNTPKGAEYEYTIAGKTHTSTTFTDLVTGTYSITVRSIKTGCMSVGSVAVPAIPPSPVITSVSKVNPKCYGETFTITMKMTNTPPGNYTIRYDGGQFNNVAIAGGTATITGQLTESFKVFNNLTFVANGCTSSPTGVSVRIDNPAEIVFQSISVTEHVLKATQKGAIDINVTGGTGSLKYLWSNGATTQDLNDIQYGTYTVTITDTNGCQTDKSIKIPLNNPPVALADQFKYFCEPITGDLLANDYDPDPADQKDFITINVTPVISPKYAAQFKINSDGTFTYDVIPGYSGTDVFVYEIADKWGQTASATVTIEVVADFDGDNIADLLDPDADGDGILNIVEGGLKDDTDGDGHLNWLDIDSDNDGIVDNIEAQTSPGYAPPSGDDTDKDGVDDAYDTDQGGLALTPLDTDVDKIPDFLDFDSDEDLVPDYIEGHDQNADGKPDRKLAGKDTDADGLDDAYDDVVKGCNNGNAIGAVASLQDFDGDGLKDWRDENDDDDEYLTRFEDLNVDGDFSNDDTDFDGYPEYLDFGRDCDILIPDAFSPNDDNIHDYFQIYCMNHYPNAKMYIFDQLGNKLFEKENYGNMDFWGTADRAWWDGRTNNRSAETVNGKVIPGTYYYVLNLGNGEVKKSYVFVSY